MNGQKPKWTVMVYIAADSQLANFAVESLKQLKKTATDDIVVAAQFEEDGPCSSQRVHRYIFDESTREQPFSSIEEKYKWLKPDKHLTIGSKTLADFVNWAKKATKGDQHCLILWGHGPELLFEAPSRNPSDGTVTPKWSSQGRRGKTPYLTPVELKDALLQAGYNGRQKLPIIGMDCCSMSMIEYAYELRECADYMVASQEEVPDMSFPYDTLLSRIEKHRSNIEELCKSSVVGYYDAYQGYIYSPWTDLKKVTLSCFDLQKINMIEMPLTRLTSALLSSSANAAILEARSKARGFAGGLFVDLYDFCDKLAKLEPRMDGAEEVCAAIDERTRGEAFIIENKSGDSRCHGVSIYFPFFQDTEFKEIKKPLVKGSLDTGRKSAEDLNQAATNYLFSLRWKMISDTEDYYEALSLAKDTGWYEFIRCKWSRILAREAEKDPGHNDLDMRYSGRQCALNLLHDCSEPMRRKATGAPD